MLIQVLIIKQGNPLIAILEENLAEIDVCLNDRFDWETDILFGISLIKAGPEYYDRYLGV